MTYFHERRFRKTIDMRYFHLHDKQKVSPFTNGADFLLRAALHSSIHENTAHYATYEMGSLTDQTDQPAQLRALFPSVSLVRIVPAAPSVDAHYRRHHQRNCC